MSNNTLTSTGLADIMRKMAAASPETMVPPEFSEFPNPDAFPMAAPAPQFAEPNYNSTFGETPFGDFSNDREMRSAMMTERTADGVRIGGWEIIVNSGNNTPAYDIRSVATREVILESISLYDAAKGLVEALNEGKSLNSPDVFRILNYEYAFSRNMDIAEKSSVLLKSDKVDAQRRQIAEDRYVNAKAKAEEARNKLMEAVSAK